MLRSYIGLLTALLLFVACNPSTSQSTEAQSTVRPADPLPDYEGIPSTPSLEEAGFDERYADYEKAYFAGGCFWCIEEIYERVQGVKAVYSGYTGGHVKNVTYQQSNTGRTGHAEAVVVYYEPEVISYDLLLEFFYAAHDPTQVNGQGPDIGPQYRSAVWYFDEEQKQLIENYQEKLNNSGKYNRPIATEIAAAGAFYLAEEYHQDYYPSHQDNPYVQRISKPKVEKFTKEYSQYLKRP